MSNSVKSALALVGSLLLTIGWFGYQAWKTAPIIAPQIVAYNKANPPNWMDIGLGVIAGALTMVFIFVTCTLLEEIRFERSLKGGGTGGSGGTRRVRLPMSRKAIDISTWTPPDGQYHRGVVAPA